MRANTLITSAKPCRSWQTDLSRSLGICASPHDGSAATRSWSLPAIRSTFAFSSADTRLESSSHSALPQAGTRSLDIQPCLFSWIGSRCSTLPDSVPATRPSSICFRPDKHYRDSRIRRERLSSNGTSPVVNACVAIGEKAQMECREVSAPGPAAGELLLRRARGGKFWPSPSLWPSSPTPWPLSATPSRLA